jgi:hypothetical protein
VPFVRQKCFPSREVVLSSDQKTSKDQNPKSISSYDPLSPCKSPAGSSLPTLLVSASTQTAPSLARRRRPRLSTSSTRVIDWLKEEERRKKRLRSAFLHLSFRLPMFGLACMSFSAVVQWARWRPQRPSSWPTLGPRHHPLARLGRC